ncbi:MAG: peptidase [Tagaea sp.]|jgi:putative proteasome-type protease|nr:proteasome-type protease [Azospirillum sp.]MCA3265270.1 proteasome-type protease [Azospirillum sp.]MCZ8122144.1 proteasome-type protease [Magnetospirillum sp.]
MTYGVGLLLEDGLVLCADSRTNAGVDHVATFRKMHVWEAPGERCMVLLTAGNLAISQSVVSLLTEGMGEDRAETMLSAPSMFDAARLAGRAVREIYDLDAQRLKEQGTEFNVSMILGGQIKGRRLRLFQIYSAGNFIEATVDTPYIQIGETKYGKPILDRVVSGRTSLNEAAKCALISMDSTLRSNVSVGLPIDIAILRRDECRIAVRKRLDESDLYLSDIRRRWSEGLRSVFQTVPDPDWKV